MATLPAPRVNAVQKPMPGRILFPGDPMNHSELTNLIRDHYKRSKYPDVILPFTVLRRLDCVLAPTKEKVLETGVKYQHLSAEFLDQQLRGAARTSPL